MSYMASSAALFFICQILTKFKEDHTRIIPSNFGQNPNNKELVIGRTDDGSGWWPITIIHHEHIVLSLYNK